VETRGGGGWDGDEVREDLQGLGEQGLEYSGGMAATGFGVVRMDRDGNGADVGDDADLGWELGVPSLAPPSHHHTMNPAVSSSRAPSGICESPPLPLIDGPAGGGGDARPGAGDEGDEGEGIGHGDGGQEDEAGEAEEEEEDLRPLSPYVTPYRKGWGPKVPVESTPELQAKGREEGVGCWKGENGNWEAEDDKENWAPFAGRNGEDGRMGRGGTCGAGAGYDGVMEM
jgi:hypothetical protein